MADLPPVEVTVAHGVVPDAIHDLARTKIGAVLRLAPAPVLFVRVTLAHDDAPHRQRPSIAKVVADVNGRLVRAHVAAENLDEAVDLLEAKLRHNLEILAEKRQSIRHEPARPTAGSWRHGMVPTTRPEWFPRPVSERRLVRRKSYELREQSVAEAAEDLDVLDQDWTLFVERTSHADAVLERSERGYRLTLPATAPKFVVELAAPVEVQVSAPRMDLDGALRLLDALDTPFVFFVDSDTDRGCVVYRRYDGHYGMIARADDATPPSPGIG
ncbi:MAG: HPF/RaiA family ribosome-associated protein [Nitriliruptoraceae bacterium]